MTCRQYFLNSPKLFFPSKNVIDNWELKEEIQTYRRLYDAGNKIGVYHYKSHSLDRLFLAFTGKTELPKLLPVRYLLGQDVLTFPKNHYLFEVFDKKLQLVMESGLIDEYMKFEQGFDRSNKKLRQSKEPFKVLTLQELEAGFVISMAPLVLSFLVFCIEWMVALKKLLVLHFTFKTYFWLKKHEQDIQIELNKFKMAA